MLGSRFDSRPLEKLTILDEASFRHVALYADLKAALVRDGYLFRVLRGSGKGRWDRALLLNLTFWTSHEGGDILVDDTIPADVVAHAAWHHLANRALPAASGRRPDADVLFLGESIASAFDVYLVGRLLGHAPRSSFLETQVPAMADAASATGASDDDFETLLARIADDPERAFRELRSLLFDASRSLFRSRDADAALSALEPLDAHPFAMLLHRFELSNWVLYARAYAEPTNADHEDALSAEVSRIDERLREDDRGLDWLAAKWLTP
jgi:hypothetical protein